ncbi:conserved hypothetical protein [Methylobacterium sp. 4-46]|uniref:hypothetical protein n=1 Tax=unclassified Methylobacterium TaxID=2615210 RepID=UPI000165CCA3|nr:MULTISPECIES: hypothetical protein [Methylobacterium]ACA18766.1 conserved hypothetical protein [Methylobacterium sp. 4-46]WFT77995.1 hypothetical protein QA634_22200 [Methylobacterium nodulans]
MRIRSLCLALATALAAGPALAEDVTIIRRDPPPVERSTVIEKRSVESTGSVGGCETKTVRKENEFGDSKTVRSERCD